jgi:hypothetical protein
MGSSLLESASPIAGNGRVKRSSIGNASDRPELAQSLVALHLQHGPEPGGDAENEYATAEQCSEALRLQRIREDCT